MPRWSVLLLLSAALRCGVWPLFCLVLAVACSRVSYIGASTVYLCVLTADVCAYGLHPLQVVFKSAAAINGSIYQRLALLAPAVLLGPINLMAHMLPDKAFQQVLEARLMLSSASAALVRQARAAEAAKRACEAAAAGADATAVVTGPVDAAAGAKASGGVAGSRPRGSIAPGSFLGLLLSARDKAGHGLTDLQMLMQANTFTLAGVSKQVLCCGFWWAIFACKLAAGGLTALSHPVVAAAGRAVLPQQCSGWLDALLLYCPVDPPSPSPV